MWGDVGGDVDGVHERRAGLTEGRCVFVAGGRIWQGPTSLIQTLVAPT